MDYIQKIENNTALNISEIPELRYEAFISQLASITSTTNRHCVAYFGVPESGRIKLFALIADDLDGSIFTLSSLATAGDSLPSLTAMRPAFHLFERELAEKFGFQFIGHPWMKPMRYSHDRYDRNQTPENHSFYHIDSEQSHEVGVGPVHAGVIEPGHFRFSCSGEKIIHLETQLGYQHRGIENLMLTAKNDMQRWALSQSIAGDNVGGHVTAYSYLWEALCGFETTPELHWERCMAQELERMAVHSGDLSALSGDVAFQLGNAVWGRLRTPIINFFQAWCGNRLAKPLLHPANVRFPFSHQLAEKLNLILSDFEPDFVEISHSFFNLPSVLARLEKTGIVTTDFAEEAGLVGMAARSAGLLRDLRSTHPYGLYKTTPHEAIVKHHGDVYSRAQIRKEEVLQSMGYIRNWLNDIPQINNTYTLKQPKTNTLAVSLTEGWRGQVCHCAVTNNYGQLIAYKIVDPSFFNWSALEFAVRENGISDFPVCNKSFNLSYTGFDL
jgi:Ni,Fe-hydrogenase III large subunit/Ni,Fe-hydrogenase III component G